MYEKNHDAKKKKKKPLCKDIFNHILIIVMVLTSISVMGSDPAKSLPMRRLICSPVNKDVCAEASQEIY